MLSRVPTIARPRWWQLPRRRRKELGKWWQNHVQAQRRMARHYDLNTLEPRLPDGSTLDQFMMAEVGMSLDQFLEVQAQD